MQRLEKHHLAHPKCDPVRAGRGRDLHRSFGRLAHFYAGYIGFIILLVGITRIVMAFHIRGAKGWGWPVVSGIISVLLGIMIIAQWPVSGLWVIGLFVAIEMIMSGWSYIFLALAARRAGESIPGQAPSQAVP